MIVSCAHGKSNMTQGVVRRESVPFRACLAQVKVRRPSGVVHF